MSTKRRISLPTVEEDAAINDGIAADPDTAELSDAEFGELTRPRGRPVAQNPKVALNIQPGSGNSGCLQGGRSGLADADQCGIERVAVHPS